MSLMRRRSSSLACSGLAVAMSWSSWSAIAARQSPAVTYGQVNDAMYAAELKLRGAARLRFCHAGAHLVRDLRLKVKAQFAVQLFLHLLATYQPPNPVHALSP